MNRELYKDVLAFSESPAALFPRVVARHFVPSARGLRLSFTGHLQGLRQQFVEKDLQKESEFQQFLKEKAVIDEVVRQIEEEDKR